MSLTTACNTACRSVLAVFVVAVALVPCAIDVNVAFNRAAWSQHLTTDPWVASFTVELVLATSLLALVASRRWVVVLGVCGLLADVAHIVVAAVLVELVPMSPELRTTLLASKWLAGGTLVTVIMAGCIVGYAKCTYWLAEEDRKARRRQRRVHPSHSNPRGQAEVVLVSVVDDEDPC